MADGQALPSEQEQIDQLRQQMRVMQGYIDRLKLKDLGKTEFDAFPQVLQSWVMQKELAKASNRRLNRLMVGTSVATAFLVALADVILRYVIPVGTPHP